MKISIYKIVNNLDDRVYIGFTTQPLYKRMNNHRTRWRRKGITQYTSSILFDSCGVENCKIILEEEREVENVEYAKQVEREYIDKYTGLCVNKYLPYKSPEEHREDIDRYNATRHKKCGTPEFLQSRNMRVCCIICKKELSKSCVLRHCKSHHPI